MSEVKMCGVVCFVVRMVFYLIFMDVVEGFDFFNVLNVIFRVLEVVFRERVIGIVMLVVCLMVGEGGWVRRGWWVGEDGIVLVI